jgi:UDP-N-acetylmuramate dehydrogenase
MNIAEHVDLKDYSTMRLGGKARFATTIASESDVETALMFAESHSVPFKVIGSGSNLIWADKGYPGLIMINRIEQLEIDSSTGLVRIGAGIDWDYAVEQTVQAGLSGIEFLSLIPGTCGATPVQNVGAYGREIKDVLVSVRAFDTIEKMFVTIDNKSCNFSYRKSRFNTNDTGRFVITEITLQLSRQVPRPPFYESLERYFAEHGTTSFTPSVIREAVIAVRTAKLPDPDTVANNGSFFANPIIPYEQFETLRKTYPNIMSWDVGNGVKISAGWLIEKAGYSNYHDKETGMATWAKQSLVLINENAKSTDDLIRFRDKIAKSVQDTFGIVLTQEPELVI